MGLYVYVAGPLAKGDRMANIKNAIDVAERIRIRGHIPYVPHINDLWHLVYPHDVEYWMSLDLAWLKKCDVLVRLPGESSGADREVRFANVEGIPVFLGLDSFMESEYWTMDHMPFDPKKRIP